MKGKNFSCGNISGKRNKNDMYSTPYSVTEQLLENEKFDYNKSILEPACGKDAISNILYKYFNYKLYSYDIQEYYTKGRKECDFLKHHEGNQFDYIITNPPLKLSLQFIEKSKQVAKEKFALLLPLSYLHGQTRYKKEIFRDPKYQLTKVYIFTRYIMFTDQIREDGKYKTGMIAWAWYIWENNYKSGYYLNLREIEPVIKWIDNQKYIINAKDKDEN
jgi:hypothetical protein